LSHIDQNGELGVSDYPLNWLSTNSKFAIAITETLGVTNKWLLDWKTSS